MFTGIIETIGTIKSVKRGNKSITIGIQPDMQVFSVSIGGSVAVDGVCLTLESAAGNELFFTAVCETLMHTTLHQTGSADRVNLERALVLGERLEGHIVLGHVDDVGRIVSDAKTGDSVVRTVWVPPHLRKLMAQKGSVALDGISLTIVDTGTETVSVSFIPHTLLKTTMSLKRPGREVNIECDIFARYIRRQLSADASLHNGSSGPAAEQRGILSLLEENNF